MKCLFAGRLIGLKGVHLAIEAVAVVRAGAGDVSLTIVGQGAYAQTFERIGKPTWRKPPMSNSSNGWIRMRCLSSIASMTYCFSQACTIQAATSCSRLCSCVTSAH